jgi:hypothetical protein
MNAMVNFRGEPAETCFVCGRNETSPLDDTTRQCNQCGNQYAIEVPGATLDAIEKRLTAWESGESVDVDVADRDMGTLCGIYSPRVESLFHRLNKLAGAAIVRKIRGY